jgi:hypothetical protein
MKKLKRPNLKMPDLKAPAFLADLYYDLRDRRLLAPIALALVAIVAVPVLLGGDAEELQVAAPGEVSAGVPSPSARASELTVVEATPGLRDYHTRLGDRSPTNPFKQRYTSVPGSAQVQTVEMTSGDGGGETSSASVTEAATTSPQGPSAGSGGADGGTADDKAGGGGVQRYEFVIDAQVQRIEKTPDGEEKATKTEERHGVPIFGELPSKKTSTATLLGANVDKRRLVFLVSHDVNAVTGEFGCVTRGAEVCEILEVELGKQLEYLYEPTGVRYAIKVTNARTVPIGSRKGASSSRAAFIGLGGKSFPAP